MLCHGGSVQKNLAVQVGRLKYAAHPTHQPPSNPSVKHLSQVSELRDLPHFHYVQRLQNLAVQLFNSPPLNIPPAKLGFHHWFPPPAIKPSYVAIIWDFSKSRVAGWTATKERGLPSFLKLKFDLSTCGPRIPVRLIGII